jgi:peptidoglycan/xylan/chitin deacetylase (PgdA/CDA1 family)
MTEKYAINPIPILVYHQIDKPPSKGTRLRGLVVDPRSFSWQMSMLKILGFSGHSMNGLEPYLSGKKQGRVVGITFDDGYQNIYDLALPILKRYGHTATTYVVSDQVGKTNEWDAGLVATKPLMSREQLLSWLDAGMDVGSHTCTHADLTNLNAMDALKEIELSKLSLENSLGTQIHHFCYPYGRMQPIHAQMARDCGYVTATMMKRGRVHSDHNPWELSRVLMARATNPIQFFMKLMTRYEDRRG